MTAPGRRREVRAGAAFTSGLVAVWCIAQLIWWPLRRRLAHVLHSCLYQALQQCSMLPDAAVLVRVRVAIRRWQCCGVAVRLAAVGRQHLRQPWARAHGEEEQQQECTVCGARMTQQASVPARGVDTRLRLLLLLLLQAPMRTCAAKMTGSISALPLSSWTHGAPAR